MSFRIIPTPTFAKSLKALARIITYNVLTTELDGEVYLLEIYDKSEYSTVKEDVLKDMINDRGL